MRINSTCQRTQHRNVNRPRVSSPNLAVAGVVISSSREEERDKSSRRQAPGARAEVGHALPSETDAQIRYFLEENPAFSRPDETEVTIDPPAHASEIGIAAELIGMTIELSTCTADGSLVIRFDSGAGCRCHRRWTSNGGTSPHLGTCSWSRHPEALSLLGPGPIETELAVHQCRHRYPNGAPRDCRNPARFGSTGPPTTQPYNARRY